MHTVDTEEPSAIKRASGRIEVYRIGFGVTVINGIHVDCAYKSCAGVSG